MSRAKKYNDEDTMRPEYRLDYSKAIRGRMAARLAKSGYPVMVMIRPEVAEVFKDEESVNEAFLKFIEIGRLTQPKLSSERQKSGKVEDKKPNAPVTVTE